MPSWFQQLDAAQSPAEVVSVMRDYLATWTPEEMARLPRACRPGRVRATEDLEDLHAAAVDAYRSTRATGEELKALQLLTSYLVRASVRLAQVRASDEGASGAPEPSSGNPPRRLSKAEDR